MKRNWQILSAAGILFLAIAALVTSQLVTQRKILKGEAGAEKALIYFWPKVANLNVGQTFTLEIKLDTKNQEISAADIILSFDPESFSVDLGPIPGEIFENYVGKNLDSINGSVSLGGRGSFKGTGTFASLKIKALKIGEAPVKFSYVKIANMEYKSEDGLFKVL